MTRCKHLPLTLALFATLSLSLLLASPAEAATTTQLRAQLDRSVTLLHDLRVELHGARTVLWAALAVNAAAEVERARADIRRLKPAIRRIERRVRRLRWLVNHPMRPVKGSWWPVVRAAARRNHISAGGLYRLMSLESGGRTRAVGGGQFIGLYQYCVSTWRGAWNPFRRYSIYNGGAQIWATANAIRRGWGPRMWPNTYWRAF